MGLSRTVSEIKTAISVDNLKIFPPAHGWVFNAPAEEVRIEIL